MKIKSKVNRVLATPLILNNKVETQVSFILILSYEENNLQLLIPPFI